jgi:hypothetical protein
VRLSDTRCTGWQFCHLVSEEGEQSRNMAVPQCIPTLPVLRIEVLLQRFLRDRKEREGGVGEKGRKGGNGEREQGRRDGRGEGKARRKYIKRERRCRCHHALIQHYHYHSLYTVRITITITITITAQHSALICWLRVRVTFDTEQSSNIMNSLYGSCSSPLLRGEEREREERRGKERRGKERRGE